MSYNILRTFFSNGGEKGEHTISKSCDHLKLIVRLETMSPQVSIDKEKKNVLCVTNKIILKLFCYG